MPTWGPKPETALKESIDQVMHELEIQISDNPSFDEVVGLPLETLVPHATRAIKVLYPGETEPNPQVLSVLTQIYCLGFVVGVKYRTTINTMRERTDE